MVLSPKREAKVMSATTTTTAALTSTSTSASTTTTSSTGVRHLPEIEEQQLQQYENKNEIGQHDATFNTKATNMIATTTTSATKTTSSQPLVVVVPAAASAGENHAHGGLTPEPQQQPRPQQLPLDGGRELGDRLASLRDDASGESQNLATDDKGAECDCCCCRRDSGDLYESNSKLAKDDAMRAEQEEDAHSKADGANQRQSFNRLDPNRRSISTPQLMAPASSVKRPQRCSSRFQLFGGNGSGNITRTFTGSGRKLQRAEQSVQPKQKRELTGGTAVKLRRRTALGLISLGSSHFRLGGGSSLQSQHQASDQSQQPQQQQQLASNISEETVAPTAPTTTTSTAPATSGWRSWFSSSRSSGNNSGNSNGGDNTKANISSPVPGLLRSRSTNLKLTSGREEEQHEAAAPLKLKNFAIVGEQQPVANHQEKVTDTKGAARLVVENQGGEPRGSSATSCSKSQGVDIDTRLGDGSTQLRQQRQQQQPVAATVNVPRTSSSDATKPKQQQVETTSTPTETMAPTIASTFSLIKMPARRSVKSNTISNNNNIDSDNPNTTMKQQQQNMSLQNQESTTTLIDTLIDSQVEWRQLMRQVNEPNSLDNLLSEIQIKRQEVIHELIQTERHHCLTLALMRQVYLSGLRQLNEARSQPEASGSLSSSHSNKQQQLQRRNRDTNSRSSSIVSIANATDSSSLGSLASTGDPIDLERLFPALEELVQAHELFFAHLRLKLVESCQINNHQDRSSKLIGVVGQLGDLLRDQFRLRRPIEEPTTATVDVESSGKNPGDSTKQQASTNNNSMITIATPGIANTTNNTTNHANTTQGNGQKLLQAYAKFCGSHNDSSRYYKHLMQTDKGFKQFIENCNKQRPICRQRGIPECNLLVTQRLTKYPLLIEQLIKTSKDDPEEEAKLRLALTECKSLLAELNQQLARKESFERLLDIYAQFCPKSFTLYNNHLRFTKHDLLQHKRLRQLIHTDDQVRIWSATRRKLFQVLCLILNDIVVFLRIESPSSSGTSSGNALVVGGGGGGAAPTTSVHNLVEFPPLSGDGLSHLMPLPVASEMNQQQQQQQQQQQSLIGGSGSTLISVMANALHSATSSVTNSGASSGATSGAGDHQSSLLSSGQNNPTCVNLNNTCSSASGISIKYCFANIDNKSSVISLGKLLIRDKAANESEPRTYLISSSPRQPEMYELAFVSKRHQANFVEKLKTCIDQYNRNAANRLNNQLEEEDEDLCHDLDDDLLNDDDDDDVDDDDYGHELDLDELSSSDGRRNIGELDEDLLDLDFECDQEQFYSSNLELNDALQGCNEGECGKTTEQLGFGKTQSALVGGDKGGSDQNGGLKAQQEYSAQPETELVGRSEVKSIEDQHCEQDDDNNGECDDNDSNNSNDNLDEHEEDESQLASNESALSERARDSMDETAQPIRQRLRGARRRRLQRPRNVSNQSSSSSEVAHRQAIEMVASSVNSKSLMLNQSSIRRKTQPEVTLSTVRIGHSRASDEDEEFDSGRGHDDSSSTASSGHKSEGTSTTTSTTTTSTTTTTTTTNDQQLVEARAIGGGIKTSKPKSISGASSTTSDSGATSATSATNEVLASGISNSAASSGDRHKAAASLSSPVQSNTTTGRQPMASDNLLVKRPSSQVAGNSPGFDAPTNSSNGNSYQKSSQAAKQRKLSTVSTMSSQLKLLNKLRSLASAHGVSERHLCAQLCGHSINSNGSPTNVTNETSANRRSVCMGSASSESRNFSEATATLSRQLRQQIRRSTYIPEQKLEELRDLQLQLERDKQEWQVKFERMQEQLLNERRELDLAREKLRQDRHQVADEREQLYRKLDVLKENGILLSPSHKVIITAPELRPRLDGSVNNQAPVVRNQNSVSINQYHQMQRNPLQMQNGNFSDNPNYTSTSIQILNQQQHQHQLQYHQQPNTSTPAATATAAATTTTINLAAPIGPNARQSLGSQTSRSKTTLLMNQQPVRVQAQVPLHLSEGLNYQNNKRTNSRYNSVVMSNQQQQQQMVRPACGCSESHLI